MNRIGFGARRVPDQKGMSSSSTLSSGCFWISSAYLLLNVVNEQPCVFMWLPILCCTTSDKIEPETSLFLLETWWTTKNSTPTMTGMINEPEVAMAEDHPGRRIKKKCPNLYLRFSKMIKMTNKNLTQYSVVFYTPGLSHPGLM